jgi:hypothetical protein
MIIKEDSSGKIEFTELDVDNYIDIEIEQGYEYSTYYYINIDQARKLIKFLSEQVDAYNLKTEPKIITADMIIEEFNKTWDKIGKRL